MRSTCTGSTSGLMLFARGLAMQRGLSLAFEKRRVDKRYEAVVAGVVPAEEGRIEAPLRLDWPNRPRQIVDAEAGKVSLTLWQRLGDEPRGDGAATRLALKPVTGRSHQLRVHLQHIGHPILGDDLYAPEPQRSTRLLLHACAIRLAHPQSGELLSFTSPVPF
jgi:tRNA pseudouridine32 synthase / 23S rRNA pseudouridine746 synthase